MSAPGAPIIGDLNDRNVVHLPVAPLIEQTFSSELHALISELAFMTSLLTNQLTKTPALCAQAIRINDIGSSDDFPKSW